MYIDPFVAGVLATILAEVVIIIVAACVSDARKRRGR